MDSLTFDKGLNFFLLKIIFAVRSQDRSSSTVQEEKDFIDIENHFFCTFLRSVERL